MPDPTQIVEAKRRPDEMIAEILELTRSAASSRKQQEWVEQYTPMFKQFFPLMEQIVAQSQTPASSPPPKPLERALFGIKIKYEDDIKRVEGTAAAVDAVGRLFISC
jgi:hypothetical protein